MSIEELHEEFNDIWQTRINNTGFDDVDGIIDDHIVLAEVEAALRSYKAVVISKEEHEALLKYAEHGYKELVK